MPMMKGGELIAEFLVREKMPYVFGICGHGNVGMLEALYDVRDKITLISPRHEQTAAHMADAYFRVAHKPVATLTSCGPGSMNILMATACALADSSAFLAITANVPTSQFNRGPFQELYRHNQADYPNVIRPLVKRSFQPSRVEMLPLALRQATQLMTAGRPGPVNIDVPFNLFQESADVELLPAGEGAVSSRTGAAPEDVKRAFDMIREAQHPVMFVGHGTTLSEASVELTAFARRFGIPVISSPNGMGTLDMEDPLSLGFIGRNGAYPANQAGRHCDAILSLGARFDDRSSSSWIPGYSWNIPPSKLIQVDIDTAEIGRNYPVALGIQADVRTFLRQLLAHADLAGIRKFEHLAPWLEDIAGWKREWEDFVRPKFEIGGSPIRPERVVRAVADVLPEDAIIALDSGVHHNWFMQFWRARKPQTMLNTWGFSAMGFGVSGILGAKLAAPERPCVAIIGDGGFTMTPHVLCTAVEYGIPAVWVIWNNFAWAAIRDIQHGLFQGREIGTAFYRHGTNEPYNPDFAAMARAHGVDGETVRNPDDLKGALEHAVASGKPFVLDVHVDGEVRPPATGTWQIPPTPYREPAFGKPFVRH
ncbi:MAG: thiamine pyrophosphate-binding protein [Rhodospirillales bacterium]|nr:thiamine pyrophosphate-binding protein [Rhodospirillales bacterium]